ncbi:MAG: hypothetical protein ABGZ17_05730 [Planctomycetaceae bacterium]
MRLPPNSRDIERWYPQYWREIAGNSEMIQEWLDFIVHGGCNTLSTGPSRSGKTRTISLGVKALLCPNRTSDLDPCGTCSSCHAVDEARDSHIGLFSAVSGSKYSFVPIDCHNISKDELKKILNESVLESVDTVVYLDEVAGLGQRGLENMLLKSIDERPCIWIASAITVAKPVSWGRTRQTAGLSAPMQGRFATKVGTSLPGTEELRSWIIDRCLDWQIEIVDPDRTVPRLIKRTGHRVGFVIHVLAKAVQRRRLYLDMVDGFNFSPED